MAELMARQGQNVQVLTKGQVVEGTIKKLTPGEILMDIGAKGDALVIEFDHQKLENLLRFLKEGDRVKASVISAESEEGFPVVSLRKTLDDIIFAKFEGLVKKEEAFDVNIAEATRGGYYATTSEGIQGFLPSSQVSDSQNLVGKTIPVKIIEIDRAKRRVVFSQKAISYVMNIDQLKDLFKQKDRIEAEIANVTPYGLFVVVEKNGSKAEGFVHISEISFDRIENLGEKFNAGEKITAEVVDVDSTNKRVNLSIKRTLKDEFAQVKEKYKVEDKVTGTVTDVKSRGVTLSLEDGINGFITSDKIPSGTTYEKGSKVNATVVDFDARRRVVLLSPVLKAVPITYR